MTQGGFLGVEFGSERRRFRFRGISGRGRLGWRVPVGGWSRLRLAVDLWFRAVTRIFVFQSGQGSEDASALCLGAECQLQEALPLRSFDLLIGQLQQFVEGDIKGGGLRHRHPQGWSPPPSADLLGQVQELMANLGELSNIWSSVDETDDAEPGLKFRMQ